MDDPQSSTSLAMPSNSEFFFHAPYTLSAEGVNTSKQQRRVSLPASPRLTQAWSFRDDTGLSKTGAAKSPSDGKKASSCKELIDQMQQASKAEKRATRKKWTTDETNMLVEGCKKHGVGNWKLMVEDPDLKFDGRSPVDLKDRFRTYFNDSYRQLYPNAKTHLSSNTIRGMNADGSSLFDKMRSRKRKPFTAEEDAALKQGYEQHGTSWATIVKDPIFQLQNRRSTDLRDRFRNAFPDLYRSEGYKPRPPSKTGSLPKPPKRRKGSDGDLPPPTSMRRSRRATTSVLPDGRKAMSDGEFSSDDEDVLPPAPTPIPTGEVSSPPPTPLELESRTGGHTSSVQSWPQPHVASPVISQNTEYFSPTYRTLNMIPMSAWGPQDWLSSNSRMDSSPQIPLLSQSASSGPPSSFSPSRSYSLSRSQAILDRYDLSSAGNLSPAFDFAQSEAGGYGGDDSAFSDVDMFASSSFRGFTHHSNTAGDLIFGTRSHGGFGGYGASQLMGQGDGTINPMQLHAIDERVESIRLDDGNPIVPVLPSTASELQPDGLKDNLPITHTNKSVSSMTSASRKALPTKLSTGVVNSTAEHDVTLTPTLPSRSIAHQPPASVASPLFSKLPSVLHRSLSQPPSTFQNVPLLEASPEMPTTGQTLAGDLVASLPSSHLNGLGDDIPFLDMHYWGSNPALELFGQQAVPDHSTGALDLAQSPVQRGHTHSPPSKRLVSQFFSSVTIMNESSSSQVKAHRSGHQHQRVHSALSPFEHQVSRHDNKRKRVSWDGGT